MAPPLHRRRECAEVEARAKAAAEAATSALRGVRAASARLRGKEDEVLLQLTLTCTEAPCVNAQPLQLCVQPFFYLLSTQSLSLRQNIPCRAKHDAHRTPA